MNVHYPGLSLPTATCADNTHELLYQVACADQIWIAFAKLLEHTLLHFVQLGGSTQQKPGERPRAWQKSVRW